MASENSPQKIAKFRSLLNLPTTAGLPELKARYADLSAKFETQRRAESSQVAEKGLKNMQLLEQAFAALAADLRAREMEQQVENSNIEMTVEHTSMRVGFQILRPGAKFFRVETQQLSTLGMQRSNCLLRTGWPTGKLVIYSDHLELKCLLGSHSVRFRDIAAIDTAWYIPFWLRVRQHDKNAEAIHFYGWGLKRLLRDAVQLNRLQLTLAF